MTQLLHAPVLVVTDHTGDEASGYTLTPASSQLLTLARSLTDAEVVASRTLELSQLLTDVLGVTDAAAQLDKQAIAFVGIEEVIFLGDIGKRAHGGSSNRLNRQR